MKDAKQISARRRKRFLLQFQRYLANYLKHPGFRSRYMQPGKQQG